MKNRLFFIVAAIAVLSAVFFMGRFSSHGHAPGSGAVAAAQAAGQDVKYYRCPMHPWITSGVPAQCPICAMDLTPVMASVDSGASGIHIDPATVQTIGVVSETIASRSLTRDIRISATVKADETKVFQVVSRVMGYAEKVRVNATGQSVAAGETLVEMYSPDLSSAQEEFIRAIKAGDNSFASNARKRLLSLDIPEGIVAEIEKSGTAMRRVPIVSPGAGVVMEKMVVQGQSVGPGMPLYTITDLSEVWVVGDVYQNDLGFITQGQDADVNIDALPGRVFHGRVSFIYPELNPETRTGMMRASLSNTREREFKPGMTAVITVHSPVAQNVVAVPEQAVIHSGKRDIVVIDLGNGYFEPREVTLGSAAGGYVQVINGVREQERVVTSSQFLIDSESNLREAVKRLANLQPGDTLHRHAVVAPAVSAVKTQSGKQKTCPIMGGPVNRNLFTDFKGKRIFVCCEMCLPEVRNDPEKAIRTLMERGETAEAVPSGHVKH